MKGIHLIQISKRPTQGGFVLIELIVTITLVVTMYVVFGGEIERVSLVHQVDSEAGTQVAFSNAVSVMCPNEGGTISYIDPENPGEIVSSLGQRYPLELGDTESIPGSEGSGLSSETEPEVEQPSGRMNVRAQIRYERDPNQIGRCLAILSVEVPQSEFFDSSADGLLTSKPGANLEVKVITQFILTREQALALLPEELASLLMNSVTWASGSGIILPPVTNTIIIPFTASLQGRPEDDGVVVGSGADKETASTANFAGCGLIQASGESSAGSLLAIGILSVLLATALRRKQNRGTRIR